MKINKPKEMDLREANEYAQYLKANYHRTLKSLTIKIAEDDPND